VPNRQVGNDRAAARITDQPARVVMGGLGAVDLQFF
jgi:hypothetical protein